MVADTLACYGSGLHAVADLAGDVDPISKASLDDFQIRQWRSVADTFGFRDALEPALQAAKKSGGAFGSITNVAINAFAVHIESRGTPAAPHRYPTAQINAVRAEVIEQWRGQSRGLWRLEAEPVDLPGRACVGDFRVFPSSGAPDYFQTPERDTPAMRTCVWSSPLVVYLGTWPWYHGSSLLETAPGLHWRRSGAHQPIHQALRAYSSAWTLEGNAAIDAREVYEQFDHFRRATEPLTASLPKEHPGPGELFLASDGLLRVYLSDDDDAYLNGPLGPVAARAYNHIARSVGAFFALRRAMLRAPTKLPAKVQNLLKGGADPCPKKAFATIDVASKLKGASS